LTIRLSGLASVWIAAISLGYEHTRTDWIASVGRDPVTEYGRRSPQDSFREHRFGPAPVPHPFDQLTHRRRLSNLIVR
jgi:hypothetical protein